MSYGCRWSAVVCPLGHSTFHTCTRGFSSIFTAPGRGNGGGYAWPAATMPAPRIVERMRRMPGIIMRGLIGFETREIHEYCAADHQSTDALASLPGRDRRGAFGRAEGRGRRCAGAGSG